MSADSRIQRLFAEAQRREPDEREAFISDAAGDDPGLCDELMRLLSASDEADDFFNRFANRIGRDALLNKLGSHNAETWPSAQTGDVIGAYTLVREFGRGGMGTVWLAERNDGSFAGHVAIKLLSTGGLAVQRFKLEGHFLARLAHPNIARLLDAGVTDAGQPFLVLEYADGTTINEYCREAGLTIGERIRLFMDVADAVSHAHAHLIVHRDIKPSNVLVSADGTVKLLDFGVAKLLSPATGTSDTREIETALTPAYAAPEQILGRPITTTTDVYSLALLLFELLAGSNPRDGNGTESPAALHALALHAPPKLSDFVQQTSAQTHSYDTVTSMPGSPQALRRRLRGDLDNILQRALAEEPSERYQTVAAFRDDLQRYLNHEPVQAKAPTIPYRVGKFVRRHRGGVLVATLMLVALISAAAMTTWQMLEAQRERDYALLQQQRLRATNEFMAVLLGDAGSQGKPLTLTELLDRGVDLLDKQYDGQNQFVASTLLNVSAFYAALGEGDKRLELLERALARAQSDNDETLVAHILCARSRLLAYSEPTAARRDIDNALAMLGRAKRRDGGARADCHRAAGLFHAAQGEQPRAIEAFKQALDAIETSPLPFEPAKANVLNDMAEQYFHLGDTIAALELMERALAIDEATGRGNLVQAIIKKLNWAAVISRGGEVASAAEAQRDALQRLERIGRPLVGANAHYAGSLIFLGRYDEAFTLLETDLDAALEAGNERWIANTQLAIGTIHALRGELELAENSLQPAESFYRLSERGQQRLLVRVRLARIQGMLATEQGPTALLSANQLLSEMGYPEANDAPELVNALRFASEAALTTERFALAEKFADDAHTIAAERARSPDQSAYVGLALLLRAKSMHAQDQQGDRREALEKSVVALAYGMGDDHAVTSEARALLADTTR